MKTKGKMHISHNQGAFVSTMYKAFPVKSVCWGPGRWVISKVHHLIKALGYWTEGSEVLSQSLTEVSAQSG